MILVIRMTSSGKSHFIDMLAPWNEIREAEIRSDFEASEWSVKLIGSRNKAPPSHQITYWLKQRN